MRVPARSCNAKRRRTDGYSAVQLGWSEKRTKVANKPELGHAKKAGVGAQKTLLEFRDYTPEDDSVTVDIFQAGQKVDVTGTTKGRGMTGVMKRWNFAGMPASHGVKKKHRAPGSIGQRKFPGRVYKGKKMAGQYGNERVTTVGLELLEIRLDENLLLIKGAIPGANGGLVIVKDSQRRAS